MTLLRNYKLVYKGGPMVDIVETATKQVIATVPTRNGEAKKLCRHLNIGGGFDSWTPAFFLARIPLPG